MTDLKKIFSKSHDILEEDAWGKIFENQTFQDIDFKIIEKAVKALCLPEFIIDLARIEKAIFDIKNKIKPKPETVREFAVNPDLELIPVEWKYLSLFFDARESSEIKKPEPGSEIILVFPAPKDNGIKVRPAENEDLLALKIVAEGLRTRSLSKSFGLDETALRSLLHRKAAQGILYEPTSLIRRHPSFFPVENAREDFLEADYLRFSGI